MATTGKTGKSGPRAIQVTLSKTSVTVYAGPKVLDALEEVTAEMTLYHGVRLAQVMEALYLQGQKDGRREVFEEFDKLKARPELKHGNPGRPTKKNAKRVAAKKAPTKKASTKKAAARTGAVPVKKAAAKPT